MVVGGLKLFFSLFWLVASVGEVAELEVILSQGGYDYLYIHPQRHLTAIELAAERGHVGATRLLFGWCMRDSRTSISTGQLLKWVVKAVDHDWPILVDVVLDDGLLPIDAIVKPVGQQTILMHAAKKGRVSMVSVGCDNGSHTII